MLPLCPRPLVVAAVLTLFASLLPRALAASSPGVHLFILSGQSNMAAVNPADAFLPEIHALLPRAEVLHLKVAVGGEPIRFWLPEWETIATEAGVDPRNEKGPIYYEQILAQFKALQATHPSIDSITFCWMQGERDAKTGLASAYERALSQLLANLRRDLDRPDLHVVIGRLSDHSPGDDQQVGWDRVRAVQVKLATTAPHAAWVDTDDLNNQVRDGQAFNGLHYTPEGYALFARRLARQSARLIVGHAPAANGRPE